MANEKRLIDYEQAKRATYEEIFWTESEQAVVRNFLAKLPKVVAVPLVYGRWIRYEDIQENSVKYICSNCGDYHAFRNDSGSPFLTSERTFNENFVYCRKCGQRNGGREDYESGID
jgi:predicted RNA-binding Zn-ribbon protein involved in translation (DUF1610 family)